VHQTRQLRDLPATAAALTAGRISRDHTTAIIKAKTTTGLAGEDFNPYPIREPGPLPDLASMGAPACSPTPEDSPRSSTSEPVPARHGIVHAGPNRFATAHSEPDGRSP
jgi:hypothetical protein